MTTMLSRRSFFQVTAAGLGASAVAHASALLAAEPWPKRKFTMALSCGMAGVRATPREAIELAHRYGFEAVEPSAHFLAGLSDDSLAQLLAEMKAKKLVWAAEGLPVEFRSGDKAFQDSIQRLPDFAKGAETCGRDARRHLAQPQPQHADVLGELPPACSPAPRGGQDPR